MVSKADFKVRSFKRTDIQSVKKMMRELSLYHGDTNNISVKQILDGCFISKIDYGYVVEHKSALIGFSIGYDWMNYVCGKRLHFIHLFFIKEKYRSIGLGHKLLDHVKLAAQKRGCGLVYVTAAKKNKGANIFYKNYGFEKQIKVQSNKYTLKI